MTAGAGAQGKRGGGSAVLRILGVTGVGALVAAGLLIAYPPFDLIKDQLARDLGDATGRTVTIAGGELTFSFSPYIDVELTGVTISNPDTMAAGNVFTARTVTTKIELLPLIKRRINIVELGVVEPKVMLEEAADGQRNWVFSTKERKGEAMRMPPSAVIEEGTLSFVSAKTGASRLAEDLNAVISHDGVTGAATAKGNVGLNKQLVNFTATLADSFAAIDGRTSAVTMKLDGRHLKADLAGDMLFASAAELVGNVNGSTPSLLELAQWLGFEVSPSGEPIKASIAGEIKATTSEVIFPSTDIMINGASSQLKGRLELAGPRPKLAGEINAERIDLGRVTATRRAAGLMPEAAPSSEDQIEVTAGWEQLLADLETLERGASAAAAPEALALEARPASGWSEQPFNFRAIRAIDLDIILTAKEIAYGALDLAQGRIKTVVTDGVLEAQLEELAVGDGKATGTINLDSRANPPQAAISLKMTDVAAEPIIAELTGKPLLSGISNVEIVAQAAGQTQSQLASTLEGKARFNMAKGAVRGFDVRRMVSEWWRKWKFDLAMKTGFEKLEAQYDIKKGVLKSEPGLAMDGSEVEISSRGDVNVAAKRINQEIRIKVVPPPTALPIPVRISGSWSKPSIGVDWGGLFSSTTEVAADERVYGPQGVALAETPPPPEVRAAITRVLEANLPPDRLSESGREMLRSLLPQEPTQ